MLKQALETFWKQKMAVLEEEGLREEIHVFKIIKPRKMSKILVDGGELGDYAKVVLRMRPGAKKDTLAEDLQEAILAHARAQNWCVTVGTAPRSKKERDLRDTIEEAKSALA